MYVSYLSHIYKAQISVISKPSVEFKSPGKEFNSSSWANIEQVSLESQICPLNRGSPRRGTLSSYEESGEKQIRDLSFSPFILSVTVF